MKCKYCEKETEKEYCHECQEIRETFEKARIAEDHLIAFRKVRRM